MLNNGKRSPATIESRTTSEYEDQEDILSGKKRKINCDDQVDRNNFVDYSLFSNDTVFYMMQFIESNFLINTCTLVSKDWYDKACQIPVSLYFNAKRIYLTGLQELIESNYQFLKNLTILNLGDNKIGNEGMKHLTECKNLSNLTHLEIYKNSIGLEGINYLCEGNIIRKLMKLNLSGNQIDDECLKSISDSCNFSNLTLLNLGSNRITEKGLEYLVQYSSIGTEGNVKNSKFNPSNLLRLNLASNKLNGKGTKLIYENMRNLIRLDIRMNKISATDSSILRTELVNLKEYYYC